MMVAMGTESDSYKFFFYIFQTLNKMKNTKKSYSARE